ncbi:hypothetical protein MOUN0_N12354 [Monosporozyma unispora]
MALCILSPWECRSRNGPQVNGRAFPVSGECAARIISTEKTSKWKMLQSSIFHEKNAKWLVCNCKAEFSKLQSGIFFANLGQILRFP